MKTSKVEYPSWIHVPMGFVGRFDSSSVRLQDESVVGLCTSQFTSCWPIIAISHPSKKSDAVRASLIHFDDDLSPWSIKKELDEFIASNGECSVFIYRQSITKNQWGIQGNKMGLLTWLKEENENIYHSVIDLAPDSKSDNIGFIGIKFADLAKIDSEMSPVAINKFIQKSVILFPRSKRDRAVQENHRFMLRHPQEMYLQCYRQVSYVLEDTLYDWIISNAHKLKVIHDGSHWLSIEGCMNRNKMNKFCQRFKGQRGSDITSSIGKISDSMAFQMNPNMPSLMASAVLSIQLWNNNMDLKASFKQRLINFNKEMLTGPMGSVFCQKTNEQFELVGDNRLKIDKVRKTVKKLKRIANRDNWTHFGNEIFGIAGGYLQCCNILTGLFDVYNNIKPFVFQCELSEMETELTEYNMKGSVHYREKQFNKAIGEFTRALHVASLCFVDGDRRLVQCYYNLGASCHQNNELSKAKDALLVAQNLGQNGENIDSLMKKISKRLKEIDIQ